MTCPSCQGRSYLDILRTTFEDWCDCVEGRACCPAHIAERYDCERCGGTGRVDEEEAA